jgi:hypothetical protein
MGLRRYKIGFTSQIVWLNLEMRFILYNQWSWLPESANILFSESEQESLFFSRIWLENLTTHALAENQSILLACVVENESLLAILPMIKNSQSNEGGLSSLSNNFTSLYSLLISNNNKDTVLTCLANGLSQMPTQPILFEPIDTNDSNIIRLRQLMESCGFQSHSYFRFYNWMHPLKGQSFDEYMAERPANLRNTIKRKQRKLEREYGYDIRLYKDTGTDYSLINKALADYHAIYKKSWKTNEFFSDFTPSLVKSLSQLGWSRLAILYINEQPVAAQIWFVLHDKANIYRLVFDENWKSYSPGSILTQYLMRYVIDTDKVTEIDFLNGNERYKQDWMSVRRERFGIRFAKQPEQKNSFSRTIQTLKTLLSRS